ncbi:Calcineurin-like phosphoesterase domain-containing protein [Entamoeba marina]
MVLGFFFIQSVILALLIIGVLLVHFSSLKYQRLRVTRINLPLHGLKSQMKVVILSDFHIDKEMKESHPRLLRDSALTCLDEQPDLVLLLGDYVQLNQTDINAFATTYECITKRFKTIGIIEKLESIGVVFLSNKGIDVNGIHFYGIPYYTNHSQLVLPSKDSIVLLSHTPSVLNDSYFQTQSTSNIIGVLCGHTHGGQVILPFLGSPLTLIKDWMIKWWRKMYLRVIDIKKWKVLYGLQHVFFQHHSIPVIVTSGLGSHYGIRFNCPPEIVVATFQPI